MRDYHFPNLQIVLLRHWWISLCLSQICWTFHGYLSWGFGTRQENQFNDDPPPHTHQKISSCPWDRKCNFFFNFLLFLFLSSLLIFFHSFLSSLFFFLSHFPFSQTLSIFFSSHSYFFLFPCFLLFLWFSFFILSYIFFYVSYLCISILYAGFNFKKYFGNPFLRKKKKSYLHNLYSLHFHNFTYFISLGIFVFYSQIFSIFLYFTSCPETSSPLHSIFSFIHSFIAFFKMLPLFCLAVFYFKSVI